MSEPHHAQLANKPGICVNLLVARNLHIQSSKGSVEGHKIHSSASATKTVALGVYPGFGVLFGHLEFHLSSLGNPFRGIEYFQGD